MTTETNKVPQVTLAFWAIKICATTLGVALILHSQRKPARALDA